MIHLDLHYWKPGWVKPSDEEWREKQRTLLADDAWIADGELPPKTRPSAYGDSGAKDDDFDFDKYEGFDK